MVFIVEDDDSVRCAFERLVLLAGFQARTFSSAAEFLASPGMMDGACIISDIRMRGVSGLDLACQLRKQGVQTGMIFVTAYDSEEFRRKAQQLGAVAYYRKPVDEQALLDSIEWAFNHHESKA
ncbi:MAG TPA: response regulator [Luteolibacter sp.]|nr:response regulator [Luteolibacter sp.]